MLSALPQSKIFSGALFARQVRSSRLFQRVEEVVYTREHVVLALRHAQSTLGVRSKLPGDLRGCSGSNRRRPSKASRELLRLLRLLRIPTPQSLKSEPGFTFEDLSGRLKF